MKAHDESNLSYDTRLFIDDAVYHLWQERGEGQALTHEQLKERVMSDWLYHIGKQLKEDGEELMGLCEQGDVLSIEACNNLEGSMKATAGDFQHYTEIGEEALEDWKAREEEEQEDNKQQQ